MDSDRYVFAGDEAGDASLRFERGASRYLVFALVGTSEPDRLRQALNDLRSKRRLRADFEFKFHRLGSRHLREALWATLNQIDFNAWIVVADKQKLPELLRIMPSRALYVYFLSEAMLLVPEALRGRRLSGSMSTIVQERRWPS